MNKKRKPRHPSPTILKVFHILKIVFSFVGAIHSINERIIQERAGVELFGLNALEEHSKENVST